jgi:DUF2075 family protein
MTGFRVEKLTFESKSVELWSRTDSRNNNWPIVYTINNDNEIYVGETVNAAGRLSQHLGVSERKHLKKVQIIKNEMFNKSVCLDLESHLIRYFAADGKYKVLNGNLGITEADYYEREKYRQSFQELFELLVKEGYLSRSVPEIVNSDSFKYSPFKALNQDQAIALTGILDRFFGDLSESRDDELVIRGEPGTGKTIVAIYLIKLLKDIGRFLSDDVTAQDSVFSDYFTESNRSLITNINIGLVIPQQSLRKTVQKVFASTPGLDKSKVMSPFNLGLSREVFDLLIVDETHRLGQRANQSSANQNKQFKQINEDLFGEDDIKLTQLDWVRKKSKKRILLVDAAQSIRPADLPAEVMDKIVNSAEKRDALFMLSSQMRVLGGDDYIDWASDLFSESPRKYSSSENYDLRFFEKFKDMKAEIESRNSEVGLSRLLAGFAWPWNSKDDRSRFDIEIDGIKLFWNRTAVDWINSKTSHEEVGSIHTIQGYDLNYAGVIIGSDLSFDQSAGRVVFNRDHYFDVKGRENNPKLGKTYSDEEIRQFVINIYRVLLTRGIKGTYVYIVDYALRKHLKNYFLLPNSSA